jgi:hypothetical protein
MQSAQGVRARRCSRCAQVNFIAHVMRKSKNFVHNLQNLKHFHCVDMTLLARSTNA